MIDVIETENYDITSVTYEYLLCIQRPRKFLNTIIHLDVGQKDVHKCCNVTALHYSFGPRTHKVMNGYRYINWLSFSKLKSFLLY